MVTIEDAIKRELSCAMQAERILHPRDNTYLHASQIGQCRRANGFRLMGTEEVQPDSHFLSVCDVGHGLHRQIQDRLVNVLKWCAPENIEVSLRNDEYQIRGTADAITWPLNPRGGRLTNRTALDRDGGKRYIIDIKSITARPRFLRDVETGALFGEEAGPFDRLENPKKEHLQQVFLYSWMTKEKFGLDYYPPTILIYIGKDVPWDAYTPHADSLLDVPYKVFVREVDEKILLDTLTRARYIVDKTKKGLLPARDYFSSPGKIDWHCETCSFRKACYPEIWGNEVLPITDASQRIISEYAEVE
jgi:hypothetical protein